MNPYRQFVICVGVLISILSISAIASEQEDVAADTVAGAFMKSRDLAQLPKLERMGKNMFREKLRKHDLRFSSGLINNVQYETSDPNQLPESAHSLALAKSTGKTAARFGVGVCLAKPTSDGKPTYSILIAAYESRATSFWRIFWE